VLSEASLAMALAASKMALPTTLVVFRGTLVVSTLAMDVPAIMALVALAATA
jgi:hypothetical protein